MCEASEQLSLSGGEIVRLREWLEWLALHAITAEDRRYAQRALDGDDSPKFENPIPEART